MGTSVTIVTVISRSCDNKHKNSCIVDINDVKMYKNVFQ